MAWKGVITNAGQAMLNQYIQGGHVLHIDGAKVGSGTVADSAMRAATALNNQQDTAAVMGKVASGGYTKIRVQVGPHATTAYTAKEIGVWAHIDNGTSQMMCLNQDSAGGVAVPTKSQSADFAFTLSVAIAVINSDDLTIDDDPDAYVSNSDLQTAIANIPTATTSAKGMMSAADKTKLDGLPSTAATQSAAGIMSAADKTKLDGIATGAEVNQNAFSNVKVGSTTVAADGKTDTLELVGGTNMSLSPDATNDKVTINHGTSGVTAGSKGDTTAKTPGFGGTFKALSGTVDAQGHLTAFAEHNVTIPNAAATQSAAGLMSAADKTKLDGVAAQANKYTHPSYTARTGPETGAQTPAFGATFNVGQVASDATGHVTGITTRTVKIPNAAATTSAAGLMSATDKTKLDGVANGANNYTHPSVTARTGPETGNQTPAFGGTFNVGQVTSDGNGHVTGITTRTVKIPDATATTSANGLMSATDKSNLDTKCIREKARPTAYTSLDQFTEPGVYYVSGNTVPNGWPVNYAGGDNCILEVIRAQGASASVVAYTQRLTGNTNSTAGVKLFVRGKYGTGAWRTWLEVKTEYYE